MIRWTRSAKIVPAKYIEAIHWAKEMAEFISKKASCADDCLHG